MTHQQQTAFEIIVGMGEIACNVQFFLFPQCFRLNQMIVSPFVHIFDIISLFVAEFKEPKIGISGKGLKYNTWRHFQTDKIHLVGLQHSFEIFIDVQLDSIKCGTLTQKKPFYLSIS